MKAIPILFVAFSLQAEERVLPITQFSSTQDIQEIATIVRAILEIREVSVDGNSLRVNVEGPQITAAEWLVSELDRPSGRSEHVLSEDDRVRILDFKTADQPQQLQEAATTVRSISEIRRLFTFNAPRRIVVRGSKDQMEQAAWMLTQLGATVSDPVEMKISNTQVLRMYTLPQYKPFQDLQEAATVLRSTASIRYAFTYNPNQKLALRGSPSDMAVVDFLLKEFDRAGDSGTTHRIQRGSGVSVRVLDASSASDGATLQNRATVIRSILNAPQVYGFSSRKKIAIRGYQDDIELAEWMIGSQASKPDFDLGAVREFRLPFANGSMEFQEAATVARSLGEIGRIVAQNETKSVFVRGHQAELDLASWVFGQLASKANGETKYGADTVKVFFLDPASVTVQQLQQTVARVRGETKIPRMFTYNASRAIFVRGTAEQVARAEVLLK